MRTCRRDHDDGFTLIEVVVALALFALIAAAAAALVTTILDAQRRTDGRLERLADLERVMALVGRDFDEIADAPLVGGSGGVAFERHDGRLSSNVSYRVAGGRLDRIRDGQPQHLLDHIAALRWRYLVRSGQWQNHWPADEEQARVWPIAVAVDLDLNGPPPNGHLRRVVDLPARPLPPGAITP